MHCREKNTVYSKICQSLHGENSEQQPLGGAVPERIAFLEVYTLVVYK